METIAAIGEGSLIAAGVLTVGAATFDIVSSLPTIFEYKEHTSGARNSTKGKHQKGQTRRARDHGGEKGDVRRPYKKGNTSKTPRVIERLF